MNATTTALEPTDSIPGVAIAVLHDFRNPLATIRASSEMLIRAGLSEPQVQRIARNVQGATARIQELLDEFLDQCRGTERKPELCDLRELALNAADWITDHAESQCVTVVHDVPEGLVISVDRHRIYRVLVNLLWNALEVMPDGGTIHVSAVSESNAVVIQVRDTGPGIAPEIRDRLFEPFATAGKAGGMGLGLALSRQAVIDHGGKMWAESSRQGACFAIRLPAIAPRRVVSG